MAMDLSNGYLYRDSGGITNTNNFTLLFAIKMLLDVETTRYIVTVRPSNQSTGHSILTYDEGPVLSANYSTSESAAFAELAVGNWYWMALVGNGGTLSLHVRDAGGWQSKAVAQTAFTSNLIRLGNDTAPGTPNTPMKLSHIREFNRVFSVLELETEISSRLASTTNLVSAKSGVVGINTDPLAGEFGTAFLSSGTILTDQDEPTFSGDAYVTITADLMPPSAHLFIPFVQTWPNFTQIATATVTPGDPEVPVTITMGALQNLAEFTQTAVLDAPPPIVEILPPTMVVNGTSQSPVAIVGTGEPGATVVLYVDSSPRSEQIVVGPTGNWSASIVIVPGNYNIQAVQSKDARVSTFSSIVPIVVQGVPDPGPNPIPTPPNKKAPNRRGARRSARTKRNTVITNWPTKR